MLKLSCGGGHLGFSIHQKTHKRFKGSYEEHCYQETIPSHVVLKKKDFSNFSQSESIIGFRSHDEFQNDK